MIKNLFFRYIKVVSIFSALLFAVSVAKAQAPNISYPNGANNLIVGKQMSGLSPTNSGGSLNYGLVSTLAGKGFDADGTGTEATFYNPISVAVDAVGITYVADMLNHKIRRVSTSGVVTTFAGSGKSAITNGTGTAASFGYITSIAIDTFGNLYVADGFNFNEINSSNGCIIRKITKTGVVTTLAGHFFSYASSGTINTNDGTGTAASFNYPCGLATDVSGNIYVAESNSNKIRKITQAGVVTTFAGSGKKGVSNAAGTIASFYYPYSVSVDASNNVYVADTYNNRIRKISQSGNVITMAGSGNSGSTDGTGNAVSFSSPTAVAVDANGNVFVTEKNTNKIRKITSAGLVSTFAGSGSAGSNNGNGTAASFYSPSGLGIDNAGNVIVADAGNNQIRKISSSKTVTTLAGGNAYGSTDGTGSFAKFNNPAGIAVDASGNLYIADKSNNKIRKATASGIVTSFAGSGSAGKANGNGIAATFNNPSAVTIDVSGNIFVADASNNLIRKITPSGDVTTFAGSGTAGSADGTSTSASFNNPIALVLDASGNLYVADANNNKIRKISPTGAVSTLAGSGSAGSLNGTGNAASFSNPIGIAVDASGNVYVSDADSGTIRKITAGGVVSTFGNSKGKIYQPKGIAVDNMGNIYASSNNSIFKITALGVINTVAGSSSSSSVDGIGTKARFNYPNSIALDNAGNLYVADTYNHKIRKVDVNGEYTISPNLPDGLYIDANAGTISGTPIVVSPATNYTVSTSNAAGTSTDILSIATIAALPTISSITDSASTGDNIVIEGEHFTTLKSVTIGGTVPKSYSLIDDNTIFAVISNGASGNIVVTTDGGTATKAGFKYVPLPDYTWIGVIDSAWNKAGNWSNNKIPTSTSKITIGSSKQHYPYLVANTTCGKIVLDGILILNGNTLTLTDSLTGNGYLNSYQSSLIISGTVGKLNFNNYSPYGNSNDYYAINLTITSGSAYLGKDLIISGKLSSLGGSFNTNGLLTLHSEYGSTAVVSEVLGTITGKVIVERYIPSGYKAFRQLCTGGVYNAGTIFDNWQEGGERPSGYGMYVFGKSGSDWIYDPSTGLDLTPSGAASLYEYTSYNKFTKITNTKTKQLDPYKGYYGVVYGDRNGYIFSDFDASNLMNTSTTIRTTGTLVTGTVTYDTSGVKGVFNSSVTKLFPLADTGILIANPYAAPIDWHSVSKTNMSNSYWYIDPTFLDASYQVPIAYNATSGTNSNPTNSNIGRYIQPGQGFWVFTDATSNRNRRLVFNESNKAVNSTQTSVFGVSNSVNRITLGISKSGKNLDGAVAVFKNSFSKAYQSEDSKKLYSNAENIFIQEASRALCIDGLPIPQNNDVINLQLSNLKKDSSYQLKLDVTEFSANGIQAYLEDKLLNTQTAISDSAIISFTATNNASYQNRFNILFKPSAPLAVKFINLKGQLVESNIAIQFTTSNEVNMANYIIEKSVNGKDFKAVNVQTAQNASAATYNWLDEKVNADVNYYRIKANEINGASNYSKTIVVNKQAVKGAITIFPNPIKGSSFNVLMNNLPGGNYQLNVYDLAGKLVMQTSINHNSEATSLSIALKQTLSKGSYLVKLSNDVGNVYQTKLIVE